MQRQSLRRLNFLCKRTSSSAAAASTNLDFNFKFLKKGFQEHGHRIATIDPLGLWERESIDSIPELLPETYGLNNIKSSVEYQNLKDAYCKNLSLQASTCSLEEREFLYSEFENLDNISNEELVTAGKQMLECQAFDHFLEQKYPSVKRYGGEGAEAMMPLLYNLFQELSILGCKEAVLGQAHRGRNNLMIQFLKLQPELMFRKMKGLSEFPDGTHEYYTGDVLSHLTSSNDMTFENAENPFHVTILPNPSHLEAVSPVAVGKSFARGGYKNSCPIQIHGDGAFAGQGIIPETLQMSKLAGYNAGGSIHLVTNNQVAFTSERNTARSSMYTTDIALGVGLPVIRVNSSDIRSIIQAGKIASRFREKFGNDILIDMICFRKHGHNEMDDPTFTNPDMYKVIHSRKTAPDQFIDELVESGISTKEEIDGFINSKKDEWNEQYKACDSFNPVQRWNQSNWSGTSIPEDKVQDFQTGYPVESLRTIGVKSVTVNDPEFMVHPQLAKTHMKNRIKKLENNSALDWGTAEALAVGSLLHQGFNVRLTGQECQRGTFSHRHWALTDNNNTRNKHTPLNNLTEDQGKLEVHSSLLSEEAVMAFEYGVSVESPNTLAMWEAQFGDFFNGAQIIIDAFIASGEAKWGQQSSMTIMMPHGYDGAGPEHSSCRIERFLQLSSSFDNKIDTEITTNMSICQPSTSAQYFHLLRRQMVRNYRKPLMLAMPKTLLRFPDASSKVSEMGEGTTFQKVIDEKIGSAKRVIFCSGKHYYTLKQAREERGLDDKIALIRVEELAPFPAVEISKIIEKHEKLSSQSDFYWAQEEPRNAGAFSFIEPRFRNLFNVNLNYAGRDTLPCPAVGIGSMHKQQLKQILDDALTL